MLSQPMGRRHKSGLHLPVRETLGPQPALGVQRHSRMVVRALRTGADCFTQHEENSGTSTQSQHATSSLYNRSKVAFGGRDWGGIDSDPPVRLFAPGSDPKEKYASAGYTFLRVVSAVTHLIFAMVALGVWSSMARGGNSSYLKSHTYFTTDLAAGAAKIANEVRAHLPTCSRVTMLYPIKSIGRLNLPFSFAGVLIGSVLPETIFHQPGWGNGTARSHSADHADACPASDG